MGLIGQQVGNYQVKSELGKGGMGVVYLAEHPRIGRQVAIKVLYPHVAQLPHAAERFEAEARIISRIRHPNVVDVYDFGALGDGSLYYVMEVLYGVNLLRLLQQRGAMPPQLVLAFVEQICRALGAAHDHGVVHRDLKPDNIFVLREQTLVIKILDFGIAKILERGPDSSAPSSTATGVVMGSPVTISPEQAAGRSQQIGPATDIYSLGILLYWMLAGHPPFEDASITLLLAKHIQDPPPPLPATIPSNVAALVLQCLAKAPADRPAPAAEIARRFADALEETVADAPSLSVVFTPPSVEELIKDLLDNLPTFVPDEAPVTDPGELPTTQQDAPAAGVALGTTLHSAAAEVAGQRSERRSLALFIAPLVLLALAGVLLSYIAFGPGTPRQAGKIADPAATVDRSAKSTAPAPPDARPAPDRRTIAAPSPASKPVLSGKRRPKRKRGSRPHQIGDGTMEVDL
jgi:serine/threonine-protein kinase